MQQPPRDPKEPILTRNHWLAIGGYGLLITIATLGALGLALTWLEMEQQQAVTISFLTLAFAQLWHVFNMRDKDSGLFRNEIIRNPFIWGALALCAVLLLGAVYLPPLASALKVVDPGLHGWFLIIAMSFIPVTVGQILKLVSVGRSKEL